MRKLILAAIVAAAFSIPAFAAQTTPATSAPASANPRAMALPSPVTRSLGGAPTQVNEAVPDAPVPSFAVPIVTAVTMSSAVHIPRPVVGSEVRFFETGWIISVVANSAEKSSPPANNFVSSSTVAGIVAGSRCLVWHSTQTPALLAR